MPPIIEAKSHDNIGISKILIWKKEKNENMSQLTSRLKSVMETLGNILLCLVFLTVLIFILDNTMVSQSISSVLAMNWFFQNIAITNIHHPLSKFEPTQLDARVKPQPYYSSFESELAECIARAEAEVVMEKHKLQVKPAVASQHEEYKVYSMTPRGKEAKHGVASTGKKEEKWEDICMVEKKEQTLDVNGPDISVAGIDSNKSPSWSSTIANCKAGIK